LKELSSGVVKESRCATTYNSKRACFCLLPDSIINRV
jgi:hypothetical protein